MAYTLPRRDLIKFAAAGGLMMAPGARLLAQTTPSTQPDVPIELSMSGPQRTFTTRPKAAILSYPIRYIMAGEGNGGGRVGIFLTLRGPTEADMALLAGEARDDLAQRLEAIGFPVMTQADMMANPTVAALDWGQPHWDDGTPDPLGRRIWYNTGLPGAPVLNRWGSTTGSAEFGIINRMAAPSRALDAVIIIPSLFLEFSTVSGSVRSGSQGSTSWTGGELAFGFKPYSWTYCMAGGQRNIEAFATSFNPRGRGVISPRQLPGQMHSGVAAPSADMTERLGRARIDAFDVDMVAWRDWVRAAFRGYNSQLVGHIQEARAG
jgi:hypothetical protein